MKPTLALLAICSTALLIGHPQSLQADDTQPSTSSSSLLATSSTSDPSTSSSEEGSASSTTTEPSTSTSDSSSQLSSTSTTLPSLSSSTTSQSSSFSSSTPSDPITTTPSASTTPQATDWSILRLYHPQKRSHFYTRNIEEYRKLATYGWRQEGVAWTSSSQLGEPVYRLFHPQKGVYSFTKSLSEYETLGARGWRQEGIAFRSYGQQAVYRLRIPKQDTYFYTRSTEEYNSLVLNGWIPEGVAFLANSSPSHHSQTPPATQPFSGKLSVKHRPDAGGSFTVVISNISSPFPIEKLQVAVWSHNNGQDDLIWYTPTRQADGTYHLNVFPHAHKQDNGTYHLHLYYTVNQKSVFISSQTTEVAQRGLSNDFIIDKRVNQKNELVLTLSNVDSRIAQLQIPIWTDIKGQDDLIWYTAKKVGATQFKLTVPLKNHHFATGLYHIHFYGKSVTGLNIQRTDTYTLSQLPQAVSKPSINLQGHTPHLGNLQFLIKETPLTKKIATIRIAM